MLNNLNDQRIENFTLGTDPEFIIVDKNNNLLSAQDYVPGKKGEGFDLGEGFACEADGVMAELTVPPTSDKKVFIDNVNIAKEKLIEYIKKEHDIDIKLLSKSSDFYPEHLLNNPNVLTFGCEPSYCIYTQAISPRPDAAEVGNLRSAGFHIHIGVPYMLSMNSIEEMIYLMDVFNGVPSIIEDTDQNRRRLYGNAGDFRFHFKENLTLFEYRTLGAASSNHIDQVIDRTLLAIKVFNEKNKELFEILNGIKKNVRDCIDNNNYEQAVELSNILIQHFPKETCLQQQLKFHYAEN